MKIRNSATGNEIKREKKYVFIFFFALCLLLSSCFSNSNKEGESKSNKEEISLKDQTLILDLLTDSILTSMTLEERVGQCLMPSIFSSGNSFTLQQLSRFIKDYHVGGIVLMEGDTASVKKLVSETFNSQVPLFIAIDAEWGLGMRLQDAPVYPKNGNMNNADELYMFDYGNEIARACRKLGINMVLGPVVDVSSNSGNVIGKRSFGANPELVSEYGVAYALGLESGGVISVAKHFPGHGATFQDSHYGVARSDRTISLLDSIDLKPFRDYIKSGLSGVMAGHITVPALDPDGNAATVSMDILTYLLREELNFKGLILTDAFDMGGAKGHSAVEALKAGADLILCPSDLAKEYNLILDALEEGSLDIGVINERCKRILFYKTLFGIIRTPV